MRKDNNSVHFLKPEFSSPDPPFSPHPPSSQMCDGQAALRALSLSTEKNILSTDYVPGFSDYRLAAEIGGLLFPLIKSYPRITRIIKDLPSVSSASLRPGFHLIRPSGTFSSRRTC
jgi:hypothetical protein